MSEPKLVSLSSILQSRSKKDNDSHHFVSRKIYIPGEGSDTYRVPYAEGHYNSGADEFKRITVNMDTLIERNTGSAPSYVFKDYVHLDDKVKAFSPEDTELLISMENDWSSVTNGVRFKIGDNGEFLVSILRDHIVDNTWWGDGKYEEVKTFEALMRQGERTTVYDSTESYSVPEGYTRSTNEQFLRDMLEYFGKHMGYEYDYEGEDDSEYNRNVQQGMLGFLKNYFITLDYHIKNDRDPSDFKANLKRMLPIIVEELSYGSDEYQAHDGDLAINKVSARTLLKDALGLEDDDNLITKLGDYYALAEAGNDKEKPEEKLEAIEKVFSEIRGLVATAPDGRVLVKDYLDAYADAVAEKLGEDKATVRKLLKKYIVASEKVSSFTDDEQEEFFIDLGFLKKPAEAAVDLTEADETSESNIFSNPQTELGRALAAEYQGKDLSEDFEKVLLAIMKNEERVNSFFQETDFLNNIGAKKARDLFVGTVMDDLPNMSEAEIKEIIPQLEPFKTTFSQLSANN